MLWQSLPAGDMTEIGEEGQTLSGGQKRRVALARAFYQDSEVYLLDDPLSALDAHVAEKVFEECIMGTLADKARILCTHQVGFLARADHLLVLRDGRVIASGAWDGQGSSLASLLFSLFILVASSNSNYSFVLTSFSLASFEEPFSAAAEPQAWP